jgi:hypothetical protein
MDDEELLMQQALEMSMREIYSDTTVTHPADVVSETSKATASNQNDISGNDEEIDEVQN